MYDFSVELQHVRLRSQDTGGRQRYAESDGGSGTGRRGRRGDRGSGYDPSDGFAGDGEEDEDESAAFDFGFTAKKSFSMSGSVKKTEQQ